MKVLTMDPPNERQALFMKSKKKYVIFGGARGGGKAGRCVGRRC